jgi:anaerobic selenocysteine-containing dehydrogenase
MSVHRSYCRQCSASCGVEVEVEDNRIVAIRGDADHPVSRGYLCTKGQSARELHNGEDRLVAAQKRRPDGSFRAINTMAALKEIAEQLRRVLEAHGPRSVGLYYGTGACFNGLSYGMARTWLAGTGSPEHYSSFTVDQSAKWVSLSRIGQFATGKPYIDDVDVMLIAGVNPVVSHLGYPLSPMPMSAPMRPIKQARKRGAKLIVIDPRRTETARQADLFLQIRPGEDAVLFAAMIRLILERGWQDMAFCDRFVTSINRLREAVADFTLEYAAGRTGIEADLIATATELFATARRQSASSGTGTNMAAHSNLAEHLLECLNALCGGYRRAGDPIRATGGIFDLVPTVEMVVPPRRDWETGPRLRTVDAGLLNGEFPTSRLPDEILHRGEDRLRALVVSGGNPASAIGDRARTARALKSLELLVVIDPRLSETARMADYVIPTKLPYERQDLTITQDNWFPYDFAQFTEPCVTAPEGMLDDWEVFWELGRLMELPMEFRTGPYGVSLPRGPLDMTHRPTTIEMLRLACEDARVTPDDLRDHPSGRIVTDGSRVRAAEEDDGNRLDVCAYDVFQEIRALRRESPGDPTYRYQLTSRRAVHVVNSSYQHAARVTARHAIAPLYMHPDDIAIERLVLGDTVEIASPAGRIVAQLQEDAGMRRGVVSMPSNWGSADPDDGESCLTSALVSLDDDLEPINFMPLQSGISVNIARLSPALSGAP